MSNEMTAFVSNRLPTNLNLPRLSITQEEIEILKMSPSMWVESTSGLILNGTSVLQIRDKTGLAMWSPVNAARLAQRVLSNNVPVLRFGGSVLNAGQMIADSAYESLPANGVYSLAVLYRVPAAQSEGFGGTGGNLTGTYSEAANGLRVRFGDASYVGDTVFLNHGPEDTSVASNYPINSAIAGIRDNKWHTALIEVTASAHRWEHDGALLQQSAIAAAPFATAASRQLVIGGARNPLTSGWQGDIAAMMLIPGSLSAIQKTRIYSRLNALKASLTA